MARWCTNRRERLPGPPDRDVRVRDAIAGAGARVVAWLGSDATRRGGPARRGAPPHDGDVRRGGRGRHHRRGPHRDPLRRRARLPRGGPGHGARAGGPPARATRTAMSDALVELLSLAAVALLVLAWRRQTDAALAARAIGVAVTGLCVLGLTAVTDRSMVSDTVVWAGLIVGGGVAVWLGYWVTEYRLP